MSNKLFVTIALALLLLTALAVGLVKPFSDPTRRANAVLMNTALADELARLKAAISQGCESPLIRDAILFGERDQSLSSSLPSNTVSVPQTSGQNMKPAELATLLDASVVSVIGKNSYGAGFFIQPNLLVTNRQAIEGSEPDSILVTSAAMKQVLKAEIISKSQTGNGKSSDFVLLRLPADFKAPAMLTIAGLATPSGSTIIAAGIPENAFKPGKRRASIVNGNADESPAAILSPGKISTIQIQPDGMKRLIHTADMQAGHAGGPLTDRCGRVVGVNTVEQNKNQSDYRILYALSAENLIDVLRSNGISTDIASEVCATSRVENK